MGVGMTHEERLRVWAWARVQGLLPLSDDRGDLCVGVAVYPPLVWDGRTPDELIAEALTLADWERP